MELRSDDISFGYNSKGPVIFDIGLTFNKPGLICILGPNGVGKSTLVRCMNKLLTPTDGEVFLDERDISEYTLKELSKIMGFVPASSSNNFSMTVIDTILMGRHPFQKIGSEKEDMHIVYEVMKQLNITQLAMRNYNELSAGQRQKVSIARGLAQQPRIFILDEPTANLDIRHQVQVINLLHALAQEKEMIVIMISHDLNIASRYADRVIMMSDPGIIYSMGRPEDVITEDNIRCVYGMNCTVINDNGRPHVILGDPLSDEEIETLHLQ
ncbi:MAG: ABC transporter ATP-binding protein [Methanomassiliicoccaceae archaeon]|nr:ABC transporter ATP-binding protein [Methanomassiliicoccaceae archaeon]